VWRSPVPRHPWIQPPEFRRTLKGCHNSPSQTVSNPAKPLPAPLNSPNPDCPCRTHHSPPEPARLPNPEGSQKVARVWRSPVPRHPWIQPHEFHRTLKGCHNSPPQTVSNPGKPLPVPPPQLPNPDCPCRTHRAHPEPARLRNPEGSQKVARVWRSPVPRHPWIQPHEFHRTLEGCHNSPPQTVSFVQG
jgi:hypothetical protein